MTIKEILKVIPPSSKDALMAAFEEGIPYYYEYEIGKWVGVNTDAVPHLTTDQTIGEHWRAGTITRSINVGSS